MRPGLFFCACLILNAPAAAQTAGQDQALLPADGFGQQWKRSERTRLFTSGDLYGHINGGAEIFLEFGFEQLTVQPFTADFRPAGTKSEPEEIQVEIYRMADAIAATGIYLMNCGREAPDSSFPERHTLNDFQLLFKRNRYYVIINNVDGDPNLKPAVLEFARHIAARMPAEQPVKPDDVLPRAGLDRSSVRFIRGPYALQSVFTLGDGDILQLRRLVTAVAGNYEDARGKRTLILVDYADASTAQSAFQHVRKNLDRYLKLEEVDDRRLVFKDAAGKYGAIALNGRRLTVQAHLAQKPSAAP